MSTLLHRLARFAVVGLLATATHTGIFTLAIEVGHIEPVTANAVAFSVAVLIGFVLNRHWTFAAPGRPKPRNGPPRGVWGAFSAAQGRLWRYIAGALAGLGINSAIMYFVTHIARWSPYVGLVLALLIVPPITFALNQYWVFRPRPSRS